VLSVSKKMFDEDDFKKVPEQLLLIKEGEV
jgi:hypothetical protein